MKTHLTFVCLALLVSCGRSPDPAFVSHSGDLGAFLVGAISNQMPLPVVSDAPPGIQTTWHSRILTSRHSSGEYLEGRQALQVATPPTNFPALEFLLTKRLGPPTFPVRQESDGWRHVGWARPEAGLGVWLVEVEDQCKVEVVTEPAKRKALPP